MQAYTVLSQKQETLDKIFAQIPNLLMSDKATGIEGVYQVIFTNINYPWFVVIRENMCTTHQGEYETPIVTMNVSCEDFVAIVRGQLNETLALMTKKMKLEGNILQAIKYSKAFRKME